MLRNMKSRLFVDLKGLRQQREELLSTLYELEREMKGFIDN